MYIITYEYEQYVPVTMFTCHQIYNIIIRYIYKLSRISIMQRALVEGEEKEQPVSWRR